MYPRVAWLLATLHHLQSLSHRIFRIHLAMCSLFLWPLVPINPIRIWACQNNNNNTTTNQTFQCDTIICYVCQPSAFWKEKSWNESHPTADITSWLLLPWFWTHRRRLVGRASSLEDGQSCLLRSSLNKVPFHLHGLASLRCICAWQLTVWKALES